MKKKILSLVLALLMCLLCSPMHALAATDAQMTDANKLHTLGLFQGVGTKADGTPDFALDRAPTRSEAITMLVRLLGKESAATTGTWSAPFTDVEQWAKPYVSYAYANGLTTGTSATTFSGEETVTASQYITFVLRALGYQDGTDFLWDSAWTLSDRLGITAGEYHASTVSFSRGNVASISFAALSATKKGTDQALYKSLIDAGVFTEAKAKEVGLVGAVVSSGITLNKTSLSLDLNGTATLIATVTPATATDKSVTWTSSNTAIVTVSSSGVVTAKSKGNATITAKNATGMTASCYVTVEGKTEATSISLDASSLELVAGQRKTLTATVSPSSAENKTITWNSSNSDVATVSSTGIVTAKNKGEATITAKTSNGLSAVCYVTVTSSVESTVSVPKLNHEYGPFSLTSYYSSGKYWDSVQVDSLVFTKCEMTNIGKYKATISVQGQADVSSPAIEVYFYNADNRALGSAKFYLNVSPNRAFNTTDDRYIEADLIDNATRIEFFSHSGEPADYSGKAPSNNNGGNTNTETENPGNNNNTPDPVTPPKPEPNSYSKHPYAPDVTKFVSPLSLMSAGENKHGDYVYSYSTPASMTADDIQPYYDALLASGYSLCTDSSSKQFDRIAPDGKRWLVSVSTAFTDGMPGMLFVAVTIMDP